MNNPTLQLKQLRLAAMRLSWQELTEQAEQFHWSYSEFLTRLCDRELAGREQNRIQRSLQEAKLPSGKTLDTFSFHGLKSINPAQITSFAENTTWVHQAQNLILFGPSGVGKTHLAAAIGRRLIEQGIKAYYSKTTTLVQKLQRAYNEHKLVEVIQRLAKFDLLILDDMSYVRKNEAETSVLFELIADRYESKSILITANQPFAEWDSIFPNNIMTVAAVDRLIHHATIISINEQSYRMRSNNIQSKEALIDKNNTKINTSKGE